MIGEANLAFGGQHLDAIGCRVEHPACEGPAVPEFADAPLLGDGLRQGGGQGLEKGGVEDAEVAPVRAVDLQHPVAPLRGGDQHIEGPVNAMIDEELRCPEAAFPRQVVGDNRLARPECEARRTFEVAPEAGVTHDSGPPPDAGSHDEAIIPRQVFENLGETALHPFGRHDAGFVENRLEFVGAEPEIGEAGREPLLSQPQRQFGVRFLDHAQVRHRRPVIIWRKGAVAAFQGQDRDQPAKK